MEIKMSKDCVDLFKFGGHTITVGDDKYYNLPFWFKQIDENTFERLNYTELPDKVRGIIMDSQTY